MSKVIGIISAKMSPNGRIPNKVILPLAGQSMLYHHIERMKAAKGINYICIATSRWPGNEEISFVAAENCCGMYAGSENDVIERHISLCKTYSADACIRIACDSPLFDYEIIEKMVAQYNGLVDYVYVENVPFECSISPELISLDCLKKCHAMYQGQAVTLPIWEHWDRFNCKSVKVEDNIVKPEYRFEVNTPIDYVAMSHIYNALYEGVPIHISKVYEYLENNPHIARLCGGSELSAINKRFLEAQDNAKA